MLISFTTITPFASYRRLTRKRAREAVVLPIRSEAPLTIPKTPEVLKKKVSQGESERIETKDWAKEKEACAFNSPR